MDPVWIALGGMGAVGVGLVARSIVPRVTTRQAMPAGLVPASALEARVEPVRAKPTTSGGEMRAAPKPATASTSKLERSESDADVRARVAADEAAGEDETGPIALILVTATAQTDQGRHRTTNEDSLLIDRERHLFAICDGMGGHAAGEVASKMAVDIIARAHTTGVFDGERNTSRPLRGDQLARSILMANLAIYTKAREDGRYHGMGTTAVAARFSPNNQRVYIAHVGDSRCYRLREGKLRQITKDHTLGSLGVRGPTAGKLVRAVGTELKVEVDVTTDAPEAGDYYVLCSDGLSRMVPNARIEEILLGAKDLDRAVGELIAAANDAGGRDNITVILVRVDEA